MSKWMTFEDAGPSASGKTGFWRVSATEGGVELGHIRWHGPWRTYAFYPGEDALFDATSLRDIADFISGCMAERNALS